MLRRAPQPRQFFTPDAHITKHRPTPRGGGHSTPSYHHGAHQHYQHQANAAANYVPQPLPQFQLPVPVAPTSGQQPAVQDGSAAQQYQHPSLLQTPTPDQHQDQQTQGTEGGGGGYLHQPHVNAVTAVPLLTPASNPTYFQSTRSNAAAGWGSDRRGHGAAIQAGLAGIATGADVMTRILMALKSQIQEEEDWALTALMRISYTAPAACELRGQASLAESVLKRICSACSISTNTHQPQNQQQKKLIGSTGIESPYLTGFTQQEQHKVLEALLVLRNAAIADPDNAAFLADSALCRAILVHGLTLPDQRVYAEFRQLCAELAEAVSFYIKLGGGSTPQDADADALVEAVMKVVEDDSAAAASDRSTVIPALRSLARFMIRSSSSSSSSSAGGVSVADRFSPQLVARVLQFLLAQDADLVSAALDFLYQYSAGTRGGLRLLAAASASTSSSTTSTTITSTSNITASTTTRHLIRLLTANMPRPARTYIRLPRLRPKPVPAHPPVLPPHILADLLTMSEPARATNWIRASYARSPGGEVTQISLWKAYEAQFEAHARASASASGGGVPGAGVRLLPAVDFIKNVTAAFEESAAMVVNLGGNQKRFIIRGIVPREVAVRPSATADGDDEDEDEDDPDAAENGDGTASEPPAFGVTVALVLQNIARCGEGKTLLKASRFDLMDAILRNESVQSYIEDLLDLIEAPVDSEDADEEDSA